VGKRSQGNEPERYQRPKNDRITETVETPSY
jgi:hypothetical protein